jgi:two-component system sensor histidine kinase DegS
MILGSGGENLAARLAADLATLDAEIGEIDLLINQARAEAERHEQKRRAASDRLTGAQAVGEPPAGLLEQATTLVTLTRRAAIMEAQVDVLGGKRKALARYRETLADYLGQIQGLPTDEADLTGSSAPSGDAVAALPAGASRMVLAAQEALRREIARAIHDGPAQSLTNIILQALIVERLVERNHEDAPGEVRELVAMAQRTLDATKSFISDVRPMVLDDLGLVPTLRAAARDRGRRSGVVIAFESFGSDRRLPTEVESALFRLVDDALGAYLDVSPVEVALRLNWSDDLEIRLTATSATDAEGADGGTDALAAAEPPAADLPPALAAMIAQRRDDQAAADEAARQARRATLPDAAWEEVRTRAAALGVTAGLLDSGGTLLLTAEITQLVAAASG